MAYDDQKKVTLQNDHVARLLAEMDSRLAEARVRLNEVSGYLQPASDSFPNPGEVMVIDLPTDPPSDACIFENPDNGHWVLEHPCGGIIIYDITTGTPTF